MRRPEAAIGAVHEHLDGALLQVVVYHLRRRLALGALVRRRRSRRLPLLHEPLAYVSLIPQLLQRCRQHAVHVLGMHEAQHGGGIALPRLVAHAQHVAAILYRAALRRCRLHDVPVRLDPASLHPRHRRDARGRNAQRARARQGQPGGHVGVQLAHDARIERGEVEDQRVAQRAIEASLWRQDLRR